MEQTKFLVGRHTGRTYQEVLETDFEYCEMVRKARDFNKYCPEDFQKFLFSRETKVKEQGPGHFINALTPTMMKEFRTIIGNRNVIKKEVHIPCEKNATNGFLGVFYRFFIKKCVFNLRHEDGYTKFVENYASIFPFKVTPEIDVDLNKLNAMLQFDDDFINEMQNFVDDHFGKDALQFWDIASIFLANIYRFKKKNFSEAEVKRLESVAKNCPVRQIDDSGDKFRVFRRVNASHPYLRAFPRLNDSGAARYESMYQMYNRICHIFHEAEPCNNYNKQYFLNLPEINFYELFSLLNENLLRRERKTYIKVFKKYLFFFVGALNSDKKPVFFIDDILFECLKSLNKFKKSRQNVFELLHVFAMMTLVYRRKQPPDDYHTDYFPCLKNLETVQEYIESFPGIEDAVVDYEIKTDFLECTSFLYLKDTLLDVCFSKKPRDLHSFFESLLMAAAVSERQIKRVVTYNAHTGIEYSMEVPEDLGCKLRDFVRKYNEWDFSVVWPAEMSFTWGLEKCFVEGTVSDENTRNS